MESTVTIPLKEYKELVEIVDDFKKKPILVEYLVDSDIKCYTKYDFVEEYIDKLYKVEEEKIKLHGRILDAEILDASKKRKELDLKLYNLDSIVSLCKYYNKENKQIKKEIEYYRNMNIFYFILEKMNDFKNKIKSIFNEEVKREIKYPKIIRHVINFYSKLEKEVLIVNNKISSENNDNVKFINIKNEDDIKFLYTKEEPFEFILKDAYINAKEYKVAFHLTGVYSFKEQRIDYEIISYSTDEVKNTYKKVWFDKNDNIIK